MDSDDFKYLLTANTTELLLPAEAASLPLLVDEPVLLEDPVMTPLEVITWQVCANSPHALLNSPSWLPHPQLQADPKMPMGPITKSNWGVRSWQGMSFKIVLMFISKNPGVIQGNEF